MRATKHAGPKTDPVYRGLFSSLSTKTKNYPGDTLPSSEQESSQDSMSQRNTSELPSAPDTLQSPPLTTPSIQEEKAALAQKVARQDRLVKEVKADLEKKLSNDKSAILKAREKVLHGQDAQHWSPAQQASAQKRAAQAQIEYRVERGVYVSCSYAEFEGFEPIYVGTVKKGETDHQKLALVRKVLDSVRNEPMEDDEDGYDDEIIPVKMEPAQARWTAERKLCNVGSDTKTLTDSKATTQEVDKVVDQYKLFRGPVAVVGIRRNLPLLKGTPKSKETTKHPKPRGGIDTPSLGQAVVRGQHEKMNVLDHGRTWTEKRGWVPNKRPHQDDEDCGPELKKIKMEGR